MTRTEALNRIHSSNGRIFGVRFIKRTTGEVRTMQARLGVVHVKGDLGSGPAYDAASHGLLRVWSMADGGYRSVGTESILAVSVNGEWETVTDSPDNPA